MKLTMTARFDGHAFIPDGEVRLQPDQQVNLVVETRELDVDAQSEMAKRQAAYDRLIRRIDRRTAAPYLSSESLRREYIYDDDAR